MINRVALKVGLLPFQGGETRLEDDYGIIAQQLVGNIRSTLSRGWWFNSLYGIEITPEDYDEGMGGYSIPYNALKIVPQRFLEGEQPKYMYTSPIVTNDFSMDSVETTTLASSALTFTNNIQYSIQGPTGGAHTQLNLHFRDIADIPTWVHDGTYPNVLVDLTNDVTGVVTRFAFYRYYNPSRSSGYDYTVYLTAIEYQNEIYESLLPIEDQKTILYKAISEDVSEIVASTKSNTLVTIKDEAWDPVNRTFKVDLVVSPETTDYVDLPTEFSEYIVSKTAQDVAPYFGGQVDPNDTARTWYELLRTNADAKPTDNMIDDNPINWMTTRRR